MKKSFKLLVGAFCLFASSSLHIFAQVDQQEARSQFLSLASEQSQLTHLHQRVRELMVGRYFDVMNIGAEDLTQPEVFRVMEQWVLGMAATPELLAEYVSALEELSCLTKAADAAWEKQRDFAVEGELNTTLGSQFDPVAAARIDSQVLAAKRNVSEIENRAGMDIFIQLRAEQTGQPTNQDNNGKYKIGFGIAAATVGVAAVGVVAVLVYRRYFSGSGDGGTGTDLTLTDDSDDESTDLDDRLTDDDGEVTGDEDDDDDDGDAGDGYEKKKQSQKAVLTAEGVLKKLIATRKNPNKPVLDVKKYGSVNRSLIKANKFLSEQISKVKNGKISSYNFNRVHFYKHGKALAKVFGIYLGKEGGEIKKAEQVIHILDRDAQRMMRTVRYAAQYFAHVGEVFRDDKLNDEYRGRSYYYAAVMRVLGRLLELNEAECVSKKSNTEVISDWWGIIGAINREVGNKNTPKKNKKAISKNPSDVTCKLNAWLESNPVPGVGGDADDDE